VVDACGLPVRFVLTAGQASDKTTTPALLDGLALHGDVVADRGYYARSIIELIEAGGGIMTGDRCGGCSTACAWPARSSRACRRSAPQRTRRPCASCGRRCSARVRAR